MPSDQSTMFENNFKCWKYFGIWRGRIPSKYYTYFSISYLLINLLCYNFLLTLNLIYTPRKFELFIREVIFYFTELGVMSKVFTIILMRSKIIEALDIIDGEEFSGDYENKNGILYSVHKTYKLYFKLYFIFSNIAFACQGFLPILFNLIRGNESELPICKYYFLSDENRQSYYLFWFIYQSFGMYGHMIYNVSIDSFIAGIMVIAITQLRLLNSKLRHLKFSKEEIKFSRQMQDKISMSRLHSYFRHYDTILKYHNTIQEILSVTMFVQLGVGSMIICVVMCGLLLPSSTSTLIFLVMFFFIVTCQIFLPGLLGTQLAHESQDLVFAAYDSEWIQRSEPFKRSLRLFMERAKTPIMITGLKMFPLTLTTFTSIMKTAYSFFALVRNFQEE